MRLLACHTPDDSYSTWCLLLYFARYRLDRTDDPVHCWRLFSYSQCIASKSLQVTRRSTFTTLVNGQVSLSDNYNVAPRLLSKNTICEALNLPRLSLSNCCRSLQSANPPSCVLHRWHFPPPVKNLNSRNAVILGRVRIPTLSVTLFHSLVAH